jgi:glucan phosphoethanolaminetransferase (alkaline phosphatase superfamily)
MDNEYSRDTGSIGHKTKTNKTKTTQKMSNTPPTNTLFVGGVLLILLFANTYLWGRVAHLTLLEHVFVGGVLLIFCVVFVLFVFVLCPMLPVSLEY